jgi:hypothetical protein
MKLIYSIYYYFIIIFIIIYKIKARPTIGFACELPTSYLEKYFNQTNINLLKKLNSRIAIGTIDLSEERAKIIQKLNKNNIPVTIWILLHKDEGYWMNMDNPENCTKRYKEIKQWINKYNLKIEGIGFDLELDWRNIQEIMNNQWLLLIESIITRFKVNELQYAKNIFNNLIEQIHKDGYIVEGYTLPYIYDERKMNSTLFQRITGIVDLPNVDVEAPMLYSSLFPFGLGFLKSYISISPTTVLGITGGLNSQGGAIYANWSQFEMDILFSISQNISNIGVYSYEGCIDNGYLQKLIEMDWNKKLTPEQLKLYQLEGNVIEENRQSFQALLYASTQPFDAIKWASLHPLQVFQHIFDFLRDWYDWRHGIIPNNF